MDNREIVTTPRNARTFIRIKKCRQAKLITFGGLRRSPKGTTAWMKSVQLVERQSAARRHTRTHTCTHGTRPRRRGVMVPRPSSLRPRWSLNQPPTQKPSIMPVFRAGSWVEGQETETPVPKQTQLGPHPDSNYVGV